MRVGQVRFISPLDGESPAGKVRKESLQKSKESLQVESLPG